MIFTAVYIPYFLLQVYRDVRGEQVFWELLSTLHVTCMGLNFTTIIITIRDLYKRRFPKANDKLTWLLLMMMTGGIGLVVYIFRYAFKPRFAVASVCQRPPHRV